MNEPYESLRRAAQPTLDALEEMESRGRFQSRGGRRLLRRNLEQIRERFFEPGFQIAQLKKTAGVNNWTLMAFAQEVGLSPWRLVQECRMETASRLLRDTPLPVAEVAFLVGYVGVPSFQRLCRRWCGLAPAALRFHLRQTRGRLARAFSEDVLAWTYWERCCRADLALEEVRRILVYLGELYELA